MRKIPGIKQHHVSDCGAACLASVAAWFGLRFPLEHIRQISGTQTHGISVQGIREGAAALHLKASAYRLEDNVPAEKKAAALENLPFPSILHQIRPNGYTHFIVCYGRSRSRFRIMDPEDGRVHRVSGPDASALWTGVVITLSPDRHFKPGNHIPSFYFRMKVLMKGQKAEPVKALAASLLYTVAGLGSALFLKCIADRIIPSGDARFLTQMGLVMVYITVCALLLNMVRATFLLRNGLRTAMQLVMGFYRHLMYLPQRFFDQRPSGELIARINDAFKVSTFVSSGILNLVLYGATLAVSFAVMFLFNWKLSLICLLSTPLYAAVYYFFDRRNKETQRRIMTAQATLESGLVDTLRGVTQIKYCTAQESAIKRIGEHFETYVRQALRGGMNQLYAASAGDTITRFMGLGLLWTGSCFVLGSALSLGELLSFFALTAYFSGPVTEIISFSRQYRDARIASERLFEIIELEPEQEPSAGNCSSEIQIISSIPKCDIRIQKMLFHYPGRPVLFNDFSYVFPAGQITAIAGESGSGKSTLASLIMRLYEPDNGDIFFGNENVRNLPLDRWRKITGIVPQKADLFEGSLLFNITLGEEEPDYEYIAGLCTLLGLDTFLEELPQGILTPVGEQGVRLSGGQRQRIALARAAYRKPGWLILDEATSSLDSHSEEFVMRALNEWSRTGMGIIIIAHRMSSLGLANKIVLLSGGKISEEGTHGELTARGGQYATWCKQQGI